MDNVDICSQAQTRARGLVNGEASSQLVSAIVCTRGRGPSIERTVRSLLSSDYAAFEVIVIDQSQDDETEFALQPYSSDLRLRYFRSSTVGKGIAANIALGLANGSICVITDDDCEVPAEWLGGMKSVFDQFPDVAVAYGNVLPEAHESSEGFIPAYVRRGEKLVTGVLDKCQARGIGASMAFRCSVLKQIGGFDPMLGPGGRFFACVDGDVTVRALLFHHRVFETDRYYVRHYGFRSHERGRDLSWRSWTGIGAAYSKPIKAGHWRFLVVVGYEFGMFALLPLFRDLFRLRRPSGLARPAGFINGFIRGLMTPIDRKTLVFRETR